MWDNIYAMIPIITSLSCQFLFSRSWTREELRTTGRHEGVHRSRIQGRRINKCSRRNNSGIRVGDQVQRLSNGKTAPGGFANHVISIIISIVIVVDSVFRTKIIENSFEQMSSNVDSRLICKPFICFVN